MQFDNLITFQCVGGHEVVLKTAYQLDSVFDFDSLDKFAFPANPTIQIVGVEWCRKIALPYS